MPQIPESWKYNVKEIKPTGKIRLKLLRTVFFFFGKQYVILQIEEEMIREHMFFKNKKTSELVWRDADVQDYVRLFKENLSNTPLAE